MSHRLPGAAALCVPTQLSEVPGPYHGASAGAAVGTQAGEGRQVGQVWHEELAWLPALIIQTLARAFGQQFLS